MIKKLLRSILNTITPVPFKNPKGCPDRVPNGSRYARKFHTLIKNLDTKLPKNLLAPEQEVLVNLKQHENQDFLLWVGHATFILKLGKTTIITDPFFSNNAGPFIFGPKRYTKPAIPLESIPKTDLLLLTHNHYDHLDTKTLKKFPHKDCQVLTPLNTKSHFKKRGFTNIKELNWYNKIKINDLTITFVPAVHWSKRSLFDDNKSLWGSFIIEYKKKKIFFSCDTGMGEIYKELGKKFGPIDLLLINIGSYNLKPLFKKALFHTTPEEALQVGKELKAKKILGMHWGSIALSTEPILEPPKRFKKAAKKYNYAPSNVVTLKIGELKKIKELI